jgi:HEAT repeat protein
LRTPLRRLLAGGDRRSIVDSRRAWALIRARPERVAELAKLAEDDDWLVSMRALDLLEKIAHQHADWVQPFKRLLIGPLADSIQWEIRLQIVRALPLLKWTSRERKRVVDLLRREVEHPQKFVKAWALDSLATFARGDPALRSVVSRHLAAFEKSGSKALATRARHIRSRLKSERERPAPTTGAT